jgi:hypothetical protein
MNETSTIFDTALSPDENAHQKMFAARQSLRRGREEKK